MPLRATILRTGSIGGVHLRGFRRGAAPAPTGKGCDAAPLRDATMSFAAHASLTTP